MRGGFTTAVPVEHPPLPWFVREEIARIFREGHTFRTAVKLGPVWLVSWMDGSRMESVYVTDVSELADVS